MDMEELTIKQRDEAEEAADKLASRILGEPIDWPDHGAKWAEALEEACDIAELRAENAKLREALKLVKSELCDDETGLHQAIVAALES